MTCSEPDCDSVAYCKGLCKAHYQMQWRTGSTTSDGTSVTYTRVRNGKEQTITRRKRSSEIGWARTPIYKVWNGMKRRCHEPKAQNYRWYGARGIEVCAEWRADFFAFRDWSFEHGYEDGRELDRERTDGNYEPGNCRWITKIQNLQGRRQYLDPVLEADVVRMAAANGVSVYEFIREAVAEKVARESLTSTVRSPRSGVIPA